MRAREERVASSVWQIEAMHFDPAPLRLLLQLTCIKGAPLKPRVTRFLVGLRELFAKRLQPPQKRRGQDILSTSTPSLVVIGSSEASPLAVSSPRIKSLARTKREPAQRSGRAENKKISH